MLRLGFSVAAVAFVADQVSKWLLLTVVDMPARGLIEVTSFFNVRMAWNRGVSFGMFSADSQAGRYALILFAAAVIVVLTVWLAQVTQRLLSIAIGLVIGGAVGNVVDRIVHGAVADFFDFHVLGYHFYTFNVADTAISLGVVLLVCESLFSHHVPTPREAERES